MSTGKTNKTKFRATDCSVQRMTRYVMPDYCDRSEEVTARDAECAGLKQPSDSPGDRMEKQQVRPENPVDVIKGRVSRKDIFS